MARWGPGIGNVLYGALQTNRMADPHATHAGWVSLLPAAVAIAVALRTRRTFGALVAGAMVGCAALEGFGFLGAFSDALWRVMGERDTAWVLLLCALFGALAKLLELSGGAAAFGDAVRRRVCDRRGVLVATWIFSLLVFLDDYLHALAVGTAMRKVTDRHHVSRQMLALVVNATAAPLCVLVPLSTWSIYVAGLLEREGIGRPGQGIEVYLGLIPYVIFGWVMLALSLGIVVGAVPAVGAMAGAERTIKMVVPEAERVRVKQASPWDFLLPVGVLVGASWALGVDALKGALAALLFSAVYFRAKHLLTLPQITEGFFRGIESMVYTLAVVVLSFVLRDVHGSLGLSEFVMEGTASLAYGRSFPAVVFVALALVSFATGSSWGVYAIALPIVVPMARSVDAHMPLTLGALVSAGAFGSFSCLYSDATVLCAQGAGCDTAEHAVTKLPYAAFAGILTALLYFVFGFALPPAPGP